MLTENTLETLRSLKLHGMAQALEHQRETPDTHALAFEERLGLLVDRERLYRQNGRYRGLLREARLKVAQACVEDISYKPGRGLEKSQIAALADGAWIQRGQNLLDHGTDRVGKDMDRVRARPSSMPARPAGPILARPAAVRGNPHRPRRRQLLETPQAPRQSSSLDP